MEQKTIKEWLETLPEPYRTQALENTKDLAPNRLTEYTSSLPDALFCAFAWGKSPEGNEYWTEVSIRASKVEFDTTQDAVQDKQVGGSHYKDMAIQPSEFIAQNNLGWYEGNVIKYVCRHQAKNGLQDLKKAIHYLELAIEHYYGDSSR
jgi:hypothetical protein